MRVTKSISDIKFKALQDAISVYGIHDGAIQNNFQHTCWIPAKNNAQGVLDAQCKNAHDIALLGFVAQLKHQYQKAIKSDQKFIRQITDMIVRLGGDGCFVSLWGDFSCFGDDSPNLEIWGAHICSDDFRPIGSLVVKSHQLKVTYNRESAMSWITNYLMNHLSVDYGDFEIESVLLAELQLKSIGVDVKSFRLLPKAQTKNPIPAQLLFNEVFTKADDLVLSIKKYRAKKPSLRTKIVPALFVSSEAIEKIRTESISFPLIELHS